MFDIWLTYKGVHGVEGEAKIQLNSLLYPHPPANFVCGGYTVFTLSVRPSVRSCVRP